MFQPPLAELLAFFLILPFTITLSYLADALSIATFK